MKRFPVKSRHIKIVDNLSYFYNAKQKSENTTQLYIKIIDCALEEGDEENF